VAQISVGGCDARTEREGERIYGFTLNPSSQRTRISASRSASLRRIFDYERLSRAAFSPDTRETDRKREREREREKRAARHHRLHL